MKGNKNFGSMMAERRRLSKLSAGVVEFEENIVEPVVSTSDYEIEVVFSESESSLEGDEMVTEVFDLVEVGTDKQKTAWCFTVFGYDKNDIEVFSKMPWITYVVVGEEICPKTGKPHLQGYFETSKRMRMQTIKKALGKTSAVLGRTIHLGERWGSQAQAADYCKKDGKWFEWGKARVEKQGTRSDLDWCRSAPRAEVIAKGNLQQIRIRQIYDAESLAPRRLHRMPTVVYIGGCPGAGKSQLGKEILRKLGGDTYSWAPSVRSKWWRGYKGEKNILIDDIRKDALSADSLLRMLDVGEYSIEIKGGDMELQGENFVLTSPMFSGVFWQGYGKAEDASQWARRLSCSISCVKKDKKSWRVRWHPEIDKNIKNIIEKCIEDFRPIGGGENIELDYGDDGPINYLEI